MSSSGRSRLNRAATPIWRTLGAGCRRVLVPGRAQLAAARWELRVRRRHPAAQARGEKRADRRGGTTLPVPAARRSAVPAAPRGSGAAEAASRSRPRRSAPPATVEAARVGRIGRNASSARRARRRAGARRRSWSACSSSVSAGVDEARVLEEVVEVQRPTLRPRELGRERPKRALSRIAASSSALVLIPTTAALCAASRSRRGLRRSGWALGRPDRRMPSVAKVDALPLAGVLGVQPDEDAQLAEIAARVSRSRAEPAPDESDLVRGDERRRAGVEHERARRIEPDLRGEGLARGRRRRANRFVELLRAGDDDPVGRDPVHLSGLSGLDLVQTKTESGDADQALSVRLSQLATVTAFRTPSFAGLFQVLHLARPNSTTGSRARRRAAAHRRSRRCAGWSGSPARRRPACE